jgi:hypothetical protein
MRLHAAAVLCLQTSSFRVFGGSLRYYPGLLGLHPGPVRLQLAGPDQHPAAVLLQGPVFSVQLRTLRCGPGNLDAAIRHVDQVDPVGIIPGGGLGGTHRSFCFTHRQGGKIGQFGIGLELIQLRPELLQRKILFRAAGAGTKAGREQDGDQQADWADIHSNTSPEVFSKSSRKISFSRVSSVTSPRRTAARDFSMASSALISACSIR